MFAISHNPMFGIRYEQKAGQVFYALCGIAVASLLVNFQITYLIFGLIYIEHLAHRIFARQMSVASGSAFAFVFFLCLGGYFWWHHGNDVTSGELLRTQELVLIFCALAMVADAVRYNLNRFEAGFGLMGTAGLISMPIFGAIKIIYELWSLNYAEMVRYGDHVTIALQSVFRGRSNLLVWINPNHADDVFLLLALASLVFGILVATFGHRSRYALVVLATFLFLALLSMFFTTKAIGGFVGFGVGIAVLIVLITWRVTPKWRLEIIACFCGVLILFGLAAGYSNIDKISTAVTNDSGKICSQAYNEIKRDTLWMEFKKKARVRLVLWSNALEVWKDRPLLGQGHYDPEVLISKFPKLEPCLFRSFAHSHSAYMDILVRGGLLLLGIYLLVIFLVGRQLIIGFATSRSWQSYFFAGITIYFTYLVVENMFDLTFVVSSYLKASLLNFTMLVTVAFFLLKNPESRLER